jgi:hypothetical protein
LLHNAVGRRCSSQWLRKSAQFFTLELVFVSDLASTWEAREKQYSRQALNALPLEVKLLNLKS